MILKNCRFYSIFKRSKNLLLPLSKEGSSASKKATRFKVMLHKLIGKSAMLAIKKVESLDEVASFKKQYFALSTVALDGMWHFGFAPMAEHFGFYESNRLVGYCCINSEGYMLQFYLSPGAQIAPMELFSSIALQKNDLIGTINGAFVSTAESEYLSLCLDNSSSFKVNALMYQYDKAKQEQATPLLAMNIATVEQLLHFVQFAVANIGVPEQWITQYFTNLIERRELFGYWEDQQLLASGECRLFDKYQTEYADLGMIVAQSARGKGIGTKVLQYLSNNALERGLQPMCSTESSNIGSQKAISHAGFSTGNRIIQFEFKSA